MIMQKETEKKYRVIMLDARHEAEPERGING
jgi:ribosomal protein L15E